MRCIFCKKDSSNSKSVEHIIPESLGNKHHTLPKGVVCDECNNYFAVKIEKTVLDTPYFQSLRARLMIENKKGKIPPIQGYTIQKECVEISLPSKEDSINVTINDEKIWKTIQNHHELYMPQIPEPPRDNIYLSKFLGLIALEALAQRVSSIENWQEDFIENKSLDELRNFVRYGKGYNMWPYLIRKIDNENQIHYCKEFKSHLQKMNEYDFLIPDEPSLDNGLYHVKNLYFVLGIMGIEYTINLVNPDLERYIKWLSENNNKSFLQMKADAHERIL